MSDEQAYGLQEKSRQAGQVLCGMDEAGRGALAGPVVAAAVVLLGEPPAGLADSKELTPKRREALFSKLQSCALIGVGIVEPAVIDQVNILQASFLAMQHALAELRSKQQVDIHFVIVDGNHLTSELQQDCDSAGAAAYTLVKGDAKLVAISAASIVAKVVRDSLMKDLDAAHPGFGFAKSAGYPSPAHLSHLAAAGPSPIHRRSFGPVAAALKSRISA
ncbi:ribonuclease HII [Roseateles asaccharophilus]|uniref:ribonuclease HII n=1 Tax=Roseateles asaccharophilus TaxID=582607 RepID=UPI00384B6176